jgi:hypothetical protein
MGSSQSPMQCAEERTADAADNPGTCGGMAFQRVVSNMNRPRHPGSLYAHSNDRNAIEKIFAEFSTQGSETAWM